MVEKPISGDEEQRRAQTRAARLQSGLPPEDEAEDAKDVKVEVGRQQRGDGKREDADVA